MRHGVLIVLAGIVLGLITHLATLIAVPLLAPATAYARLATGGPPNSFFAVSATRADPRIPFLDPKFRRLVCRFQISGKPQHIHVPVGAIYTSLSFYTPDGEPFFAVNDRSAINGALDVVLRGPHLPPPAETDDTAAVIVESPRDAGLVVVRVLAAAPSEAGAVAAELDGASCDAPPMRSVSPPAAVAEPEEDLQILRMSPASAGNAKVVPIPPASPKRR